MIDAGNSGCTTGLSKALYDTLAADTNAGFSYPLAAAQVTILKALCWDLAQGIAAKVNAGGMTVTDGATTYDLGTLELTGSGVSLSYDAGTNKLTATISGGGGGSAPSGTGIAEVVSGSFTSPARTQAVVVVAGLTADPSGARSALSLGGAALLSVGTSVGTVAAGDDSRINGAVQSSVLTTRGDLLTRSATVPARLALGAGNTVLVSTGTDPGWSTVPGMLAALGSTRGMMLRVGAAEWEALAAQTADTFVGGDGTDVGVRTATQVKTTLGLPTSYTTAGALLRVNASLTGWEEFVAYSAGHSWQRPNPVTAGGGAVFLSEDDALEYVSTGTARVAGREGSGWMRRATMLGGDAVGLVTTGAAGGAYGTTYNLSAYTIGLATIAILVYVNTGALNGGYGMLGGFGDINGATNGVQFFFHTNGSNVDLVAFAAGIGPIVLKASVWTAASPTLGLHALCATVVNVSGTHKIRFSFDGSAVTDVAIGGTYVAPSATVAGVCLGGRSAGNSMIGAGVDLLLWNADLSTAGTTNATILALASLPGTATYLLDESAGGANSVVANIRASAQRYDPNLPAVLYGRGLSSALTVASVTRTVY